MFSYTAAYDSGTVRVIGQVDKPFYFKQKQFCPESIFFEFESRFDNEGTPHETLLKTNFNFLLRRSQMEQILGFHDFMYLNQRNDNKLFHFVFIWKNPPNVNGLVSNRQKCSFRMFSPMHGVQKFENIPDMLQDELNEIPSPMEIPFLHTALVEQVSLQDTEYLSFEFSAFLQNEVIQVSYTYPFSLGQIFYDCQKKPYKQMYDILQSPIYHLPLRVYEYYQTETVSQEYIILTARVHPGESLQSYVLSNLLDFIIQGFFVNTTVLVIPCLNPDGVYRGNYRADCLGNNLNRTYNREEEQFSINQAVNKLVLDLQREHRIKMILDLHNHASITSFVCFGNDLVGEQLAQSGMQRALVLQHVHQRQREQAPLKKSASAPQANKKQLDELVDSLEKTLELQKHNLKFPYYLQRCELFSAAKSDFSYENMAREDPHGEPIDGSLRVCMLKKFNLVNVYTIEFNYSINVSLKVQTVDLNLMQQIARGIYDAIKDFLLDADVPKLKNFQLVTLFQRELWK